MIRKTSHIILSVLLFLSTIGFVVSKHFCGGKLISMSLYAEASPCCDSNNCCNTETEVFQLDVDLSVVPALEVPESVAINLLAISIVVFNLIQDEVLPGDAFLLSDSPPPPKIQTALAKRQSYLL